MPSLIKYLKPALLVLILSLFSVFEAYAEPDEQSAQLNSLDARYLRAKSSVQSLADWMDNLFLDERTEDESAWSRVVVRLDHEIVEGEGIELKAKLRGKVVLPNFNQKIRLVFDGDSEDSNSPDGDEESTSAIRILLTETFKDRLNFDAGFRGGLSSARVFTKFQYRYQQQYETLNARFRPTLIWDSRKKWQALLRYDLEKKIDDDLFFRMTIEPAIEEKKSGWRYRHDFTLYKQLSSSRYLAFQWFNNFESRPDYHLDGAFFKIKLRREIWKKRLFIEAAPGIRFVDSNDHAPQYDFFLRLELLFSKDIQ